MPLSRLPPLLSSAAFLLCMCCAARMGVEGTPPPLDDVLVWALNVRTESFDGHTLTNKYPYYYIGNSDDVEQQLTEIAKASGSGGGGALDEKPKGFYMPWHIEEANHDYLSASWPQLSFFGSLFIAEFHQKKEKIPSLEEQLLAARKEIDEIKKEYHLMEAPVADGEILQQMKEAYPQSAKYWTHNQPVYRWLHLVHTPSQTQAGLLLYSAGEFHVKAFDASSYNKRSDRGGGDYFMIHAAYISQKHASTPHLAESIPRLAVEFLYESTARGTTVPRGAHTGAMFPQGVVLLEDVSVARIEGYMKEEEIEHNAKLVESFKRSFAMESFAGLLFANFFHSPHVQWEREEPDD